MNSALLDSPRASSRPGFYPEESPAAPPRGPLRKQRGALVFLSLALVGVMLLALGLGAVAISPGQVLAILMTKLGLPGTIPYSDQQSLVLWSIRFPRVFAGGLIGAGLALAGAVMQGLFRNPLADPALVGISGGAALGAVFVLVLGSSLSVHAVSWGMVPAAAFAGALMVALAMNHLAQREGRTVVSTLLLAGIAFNALCSAGVGLLTFISTDAQLRSIVFWSLGSVGGVTWTTVAWLAPLVILPSIALYSQRRVLNALLLGEAEAGHLGFHVERGKRIILLGTTLIVGATVSVAGIIGFVGLVVPHLVRLWIGPDHRFLLLGSALLGALILVLADTIARLAVIPAELPIGIVTALFGAPFFLWLLQRKDQHR